MNSLALNGTGTTKADSADPHPQLVNGNKLLEILFAEDCRPTIRWLSKQQKLRRIPFLKIGRMVFFCPKEVRAALEQRGWMKAELALVDQRQH